MFSGSNSKAQALPEFQVLERSLSDGEALAGAAETHGMVCGMLCARPNFDAEIMIEQVLGRELHREQADALDSLIVDLFETVLMQLDDKDFGFELLLPDDERSMKVQVLALRDWSAGFLFGFGSMIEIAVEQLPAQTQEFLDDLREFCRLDTTQSGSGDDAEAELTELIEYLRVGTLAARQECVAGLTHAKT